MATLLDGEEYSVFDVGGCIREEDFKNLSPEEIIEKFVNLPDESNINLLIAKPEDIPKYWKEILKVYFWGSLEFSKETKLFCLKGISWSETEQAWSKFSECHESQWFIDNFESVDLTACIIYLT